MSSIHHLHEELAQLMDQRKIVRESIAWLEGLLNSTHWVEDAWHQVNGFSIDLMRMDAPETAFLKSIKPRS